MAKTRRRRRKALPADPVMVDIKSLSHDGRGIAQVDGKTIFIDGALPLEKVEFTYTDRRSKFDEGKLHQVLEASADRVEAPCSHSAICGGCNLQHMDTVAQINMKQSVLEEQLTHFGAVAVDEYLPPLVGPQLGYRRKARLAVKNVPKKGGVLVGFREKRNSFVADIQSCPVLDVRVGQKLAELGDLIAKLSINDKIPQIEVALGDTEIALVFRHLEPLSSEDLRLLVQFCQEHIFHLYLQSGGPKTVVKIWPEDSPSRLHYQVPAHGLAYGFHPMDFTQVNSEINLQMIDRALELMDLSPEDRVLDLFCGLGNFTLPLAKYCQEVVGVEGSEEMVERGRENAVANGLTNVDFFSADLTKDMSQEAWAKKGFDKILIDPPRSGALDIIALLPKFNANKIVYVSCNPATLARDAGELVKQGYRLVKAGVMDMFPHTAHVESIALFEK
ncbi:MAG: 23S rRNA (uracil(1939)-C(5))-methyltransferase RlmD [Pseudomonadales bacterium]|nr:23S rRNA (uracil(1939)-C(5))-methyltransferase RlmD [Pseudomonadales bacterium]